jgi:putative acetyltransferase
MVIRPERIEDIEKIGSIHVEAFDTEAEANLVEALRDSGIPLISLVAEEDGELVGHILFSPTTLEQGTSRTSIAGLAPMAVLPAWQNKGIGAMLVEAGLAYCRNAGYAAVVVLGHPNYYPRFGFVPSISYGITSEYDVPPEVFMVKELKEGALANCNGIVKYHKAFSQL